MESPFDTEAPVGVTLELRLVHPVNLDSDLPYVVIPPDAPAHGDCEYPYTKGWQHVRGKKVTRLDVAVDLGNEEVVDVATRGAAVVLSNVPGKPHPSCEES